jgi:Domain of unknown function (DUF4296)
MKKLAYILLSILLFSCREEAEKPKNLLPEDKMVDMLYDITLLQSINSYNPKALSDNKVDAKNYIYKKYKTDSLTFVKSHEYYASDLEVYESMQEKVKEKIDQDKVRFGFKKKEDLKTDKKGDGPKIRKRTKTITPPQSKAPQAPAGKASSE